MITEPIVQPLVMEHVTSCSPSCHTPIVERVEGQPDLFRTPSGHVQQVGCLWCNSSGTLVTGLLCHVCGGTGRFTPKETD